MWLVYNIFVYGMKGIWLPWLWPTFNQVFLMVYLAVWIRRSNVLTGARVDHQPLRRGPRRRAQPADRRRLRPGERGRLHRLRLPGHGQVHRLLPALGPLPQHLRHHHHGHHRRLRADGRHDQRRPHRRRPVRDHGDLLAGHRRDRHGPGVARADRGGRPRGLGQPLLRLAARPRLAGPARRPQGQRGGGRLLDLRPLLHRHALQGHPGLDRRARPELRHAAHPGREDPARVRRS